MNALTSILLISLNIFMNWSIMVYSLTFLAIILLKSYIVVFLRRYLCLKFSQ